MKAAIAVAGISIQLADTLHKLITFWKDVQRAPAEEVRGEGSRAVCQGEETTEGLASGSAMKRKCSALKISLDKADVNELRSELKEAKAMLVIVKLDTFEQSTSRTLQTQEQVLLEILRVVRLTSTQSSNILPWKGLEWQRSEMQFLTSPTVGSNPPSYSIDTRATYKDFAVQLREVTLNSRNRVQRKPSQKLPCLHGSSTSISTPFGPVKTWSSIRKSNKPASAEERDGTFAFYPSWLLRRLGVSYGLWIEGRSTNGWQYTIQPFNAVPVYAPIFRYCPLGDVAAVRTILSSGYASLKDQDPKGRMPLWYASRSLQVEVTDFSLEQGADAHAMECVTNRSTIAAHDFNARPDVSKKVSMVSIYERHVTDGYNNHSMLCLIWMSLIMIDMIRFGYSDRVSLRKRNMMLSPTAHAMFWAWRDLLLERGLELEAFVRQELQENGSTLAAQGWTYDMLLSLFKSESSASSYGSADQSCQRCGISVTATWMVDLQWRRYLQGVREGRLKPVGGDPAVQNITLDFRDQMQLPRPTAGPHDSLDLPPDISSLPYRMVCPWQCRDEICVSFAFDGTSDGEVFLPPYPLEQETTQELDVFADKLTITEINSCPTERMPGAFGV
ncbi:hypothetical protein BKA65DRAFT_543480 [Rhexocercosporidium sp. MPI-PUGE-AT-0058]|nr:hypothetical protein BKA65DRAFT_543480 [Rhexocercosporidium sp. MPI-PUGE-AT-0058]